MAKNPKASGRALSLAGASEEEVLPARASVRAGAVLLRAPDGATAASVGGVEYLVEDGAVVVAEEHASALLEHGFQVDE